MRAGRVRGTARALMGVCRPPLPARAWRRGRRRISAAGPAATLRCGTGRARGGRSRGRLWRDPDQCEHLARNQLARHAVPLGVPVSRAEVGVCESVQINVTLVGVRLKRTCQIEYCEAVVLAQLANTVVGIEEVLHPDVLHV